MDDILPREILVEIQSHYFAAVAEAEAAYNATHDENVLTAALGRYLVHPRRVLDSGWGWGCEFGVNHLEIKDAGNPASGIFQLEIRDSSGRVLRRNGLLFQARHQWKGRDAALLDQARNVDRNFRRGIIIDYSPNGYTAASATHVVAANADRKRLRQRMRKLRDIIGIDFVHARMGLPGLYWDPESASLYDPEASDVAVKISHVFSTEIRRLG